MEAIICLLFAIAMLILLAMTAMRCGVDSREGYASKERDLTLRGINERGSSRAASIRA
jgi:hypothetical protein